MRPASLLAIVSIAATLSAVRPAAVRAQDVPAFRANVQSVLVDVLVTEGGRPVAGLSESDFELFDEGTKQAIRLMRLDRLPLNVVLAFDISASVAGQQLGALQRAAGVLIAALTKDDQVAVVTFHNRVRLAAPLSLDHARAVRAVNDIQTGDTTALADGLYAAIAAAESEPGRALVIVFSDGADTASFLTEARLVDTVKRSDPVIYAAVVRSNEPPDLLREVTALSGGKLHEIERVQNLEATFVAILEEFRTRYLLNYSPEGVASTGWHVIDVRVKKGRARVQARPGYLAGP